MNVQRCPECGQRLKSNYCDICMRKVPFGGVKLANRRDPWESRDGSSAHRMERGHECVSFGEERKVTWAGSSAHRTEKGHACISFEKEKKKTVSQPSAKKPAAGKTKLPTAVAVIVALISLLPTLFGIFEDMSGAESIPAPEPAPIYENVPAIEARALYNDGEITVTADYTELNNDAYTLYMTVFNESDEDIIVGTDLLSVNGFMQQSGFYASARSGEAVQDVLQLYNWELEQDGITDIAEIAFYLNIYREDDYGEIARSELITVQTELADSYIQPVSPNGLDLYAGEDVLLRLVSFTDYSGESELQLYMENFGEHTVSISTPSISVNGEHVDAYLWDVLRPDTRSLISTYLYYEEAPIEEITLELLIEHMDGYEVTNSHTAIVTFNP